MSKAGGGRGSVMDNAAGVMLLSLVVLSLGYFTYGRFLARRVFQLDPNRKTPAHQLEDGVDFVPTKVPVLFGHHFASIAGLGPILGPAIAVIWGWVPAILWAVFGSILVGAVHDLGALTVSLRFRGRSIGDVTRELVGPRTRLLFLFIIFFLMALAMGVFVKTLAVLFVSFRPDAVLPSVALMMIAVIMGVGIYKWRWPLGPTTAICLLAFAAAIYGGVKLPLPVYTSLVSAETSAVLDKLENEGKIAAPYGSAEVQAALANSGDAAAAANVSEAVAASMMYWTYALLAYGFLASVLPVWLLLQPRDYLNSFQLYAALAMLGTGLVVAAVTGHEANTIVAPTVQWAPEGAPPFFPFLFVTIACGAVSGFHSLVSSGTTVRQLDKETDALPVGYGAMLTEGALAVLVILACTAGLGASAWAPGGFYGSWGEKGTLGAKLAAFIDGGSAFLLQIGISEAIGKAFIAVTVTAFALTTLDSGTRLLRFNVEEILRSIGLSSIANSYVATAGAVAGIAMFAMSPAGPTLWPLFGSANQLLAGLTLLAVSLFLFQLGRNCLYTAIPMAAMLFVAMLSMAIQLWGFLQGPDYNGVLIGTTIAVLVMATWMVIEAMLAFARGPSSAAWVREQGEVPLETSVSAPSEAVSSSAER